MQKINFNTATFETVKNIVSRKNQDGTVIVMKLDDNNIFFKIEGLCALIWACLQSTTEFTMLAESIKKIHPSESVESLEKFFQDLLTHQLILEAPNKTTTQTSEDILKTLSEKTCEYSFAGFKLFNLEQIEQEVLNNSIYLDVFAGSDLNLKTDVQNLKNSLHKITSLNGIEFKWNETAIKHGAKADRTQTGVIAQEVAIQFPELVKKEITTGFLTVNYTELIPHLIESVKTLNSIVEAQNVEIQNLKKIIQN